MHRFVIFTSIFVCVTAITACKSVPLSEDDTYAVCQQYRYKQPIATGPRTTMAILTLGLTELVESDRRKR